MEVVDLSLIGEEGVEESLSARNLVGWLVCCGYSLPSFLPLATCFMVLSARLSTECEPPPNGHRLHQRIGDAVDYTGLAPTNWQGWPRHEHV